MTGAPSSGELCRQLRAGALLALLGPGLAGQDQLPGGPLPGGLLPVWGDRSLGAHCTGRRSQRVCPQLLLPGRRVAAFTKGHGRDTPTPSATARRPSLALRCYDPRPLNREECLPRASTCRHWRLSRRAPEDLLPPGGGRRSEPWQR